VTLLQNAGISWKTYQEDISGTYVPLTATNAYAPRHNPFVYFDDVTGTNNPNWAYGIAHIRPYSELAADLTNRTVARYNFITQTCAMTCTIPARRCIIRCGNATPGWRPRFAHPQFSGLSERRRAVILGTRLTSGTARSDDRVVAARPQRRVTLINPLQHSSTCARSRRSSGSPSAG